MLSILVKKVKTNKKEKQKKKSYQPKVRVRDNGDNEKKNNQK